MKKNDIGKRVKTPFGEGEISGFDMPEHDCWRFKITLDNPRNFWMDQPCFFPDDEKIKIIE